MGTPVDTEGRSLVAAAERWLAPETALRAVVLVEGVSDQAALQTLAQRRGRDLRAEGVSIVAMGGATNVRRHLECFGPHGENLVVGGLCDEQEVPVFRRGLERAGFCSHVEPRSLGALGFFVCVADLEDELIRALGVEATERVISRAGELRAFRTLQTQPAQQGRPVHAQLRRFMGSKGGRKIRYGQLLVDALDLGHVPASLDAVLDHVPP